VRDDQDTIQIGAPQRGEPPFARMLMAPLSVAGSADVAGTWFTFRGIPILFPNSALSGNYAWNCATAAGHSFWRGWFYW
jgi:hypothetical protein